MLNQRIHLGASTRRCSRTQTGVTAIFDVLAVAVYPALGEERAGNWKIQRSIGPMTHLILGKAAQKYPTAAITATRNAKITGIFSMRRNHTGARVFHGRLWRLENLGEVNLAEIHWAIIGGETGPKARSMDAQWARTLIAQCKRQKVAIWVKQLGRRPVDDGVKLRLQKKEDGRRDYKGGNVALWPSNLAGLNVRRHPKSAELPSLQH